MPMPGHNGTMKEVEMSKHDDEANAMPPAALSSSKDHTPASPTPSCSNGSAVPTEARMPVPGKVQRIVISILVLSSNILQMVVFFAGTSGGFRLGKLLGADTAKSAWISASYGLTQGAFVLVSGPIGSVYGHKNLVIWGVLVLGVCNLVGGFCNNFIAFVVMRALSGIGGGMIMPNAVAIITIANPPGPTRNVLLGIFGATAPVGGVLGAVLLGIFMQFTAYKWFFLTVFLLGLVLTVLLYYLIPKEVPVNRKEKIDWTGAAMIASVLMLFNFSWNQAPSSGWQHPAVITTLVLSVVILGAFLAWERYVAANPIMPLSIFKAPSFGMLILVVLMNFMAVGIFGWYQVLWLQEVWGWSVLHFAASWTPFVICAIIGTCLAAWLVPRLAAQWILAIGILAIIGSNLLMATLVDSNRTYWPQVFPSVTLFAFSPDLVYTAAQIIASSSVQRRHQGVAASLISVLNLYGGSLGLGFAGTIETQINHDGRSRVLGFRGAFYFGIGIAVVALLVDVFFIRSAKNEKKGWDENDMVSFREEEMETIGTTTGAEPSQMV